MSQQALCAGANYKWGQRRSMDEDDNASVDVQVLCDQINKER